MSWILRWLWIMCLIEICHTTCLTDDNCKNYGEDGCESSDQQTCDGRREAHSKADEWMSLPENEIQLQSLFLRGKTHPAMQMADIAMKMKRSPNQVFILLIGLSGSGKSSTINYLFETNIAKTDDSMSMTRSTTEYILTLKSNEWKIPDLKLSLIDTPGFDDTDGLEQDAKNIMSIKYFLNTHSYMKNKVNPNLVMIVQNIMDNRIAGDSSKFAKMLKGISNINAIDRENPNVVVVLTFATSIARDPELWKEKVDKKKEEVKGIVRLYLGVNPEIVVQENCPVDNNLKRDGDWYILPNGDKQPRILFKACKMILNLVGDEIGHEAITVGFRSGMNKTVVKGLDISSANVSSKDAKAMHSILVQSVVTVPTNEIGNMLEEYRKKKKMENIDNDIYILQVKLRNLNISNTSNIQNMTINQLMSKFYPVRITKVMQKVLEDVFGLSYEQVSGIDYHVGKGYNIFKDAATMMSPLVMEEHISLYGLPVNVQLKECSAFEIKCDSIEDTKEYISERLRELHVHVEGVIKFEAFNIKIRHGYNNKSSNILTFSVEHRTQKIVVNQPFQIDKEFIANIKALPLDYDLNNETSVMKWKAFFDKWGMYVVTGAYIGGSLTGQIKVKHEHTKQNEESFADTRFALAKIFSFHRNNANLSGAEKHRTVNKDLSAIYSTSVQWNGGKRETFKSSLDDIEQNDWISWVKSLEYSPVPLWSSLDLYPLYHIAAEVSEEKSITMQKVMNLALIGKFIYQIPKEDNRNITAESNTARQCFHEDSVILLHNGEQKRMKDLTVGDQVFALDNKGGIVQDEVIAWLHRLRRGQYTFLKIFHDLGELILTAEHILFVGENRNPQHASTVSPGDKLSFLMTAQDRKTVYMTTVLSIQTVNGTGVYAPLTYNGRLLVDNVDVSCYSTLDHLQVMGQDVMSSHALAHVAFLPLRMAFIFGLDINNDNLDVETGIHGYARWLMKLYWT